MAEVLLRLRLDERHVTAGIDSAGFLAAGYPAMDDAVEAAAERGLNLVGRYSQTVTPERIGAADLVIAMERQHVVELAQLAPTAWPRVFQLRDLVRRARLHLRVRTRRRRQILHGLGQSRVGPRLPGRQVVPQR